MSDLDAIKAQATASTYRDQCMFFLDAIAQQNAYIAELREKVADAEANAAKADPRIAELEQIVREKDEQIAEQVKTIEALRQSHG